MVLSKRANSVKFKDLYEKLFHSLLAIACKYVDYNEAEDIVQDTFYKLWHSPHLFIDGNELQYYLYTVVRNKCLNHIRGKKVKERCLSHYEIESEEYFYNAVLEEEIFIRLRQAVDYLPEKYRVVINLTLEGLKDKDIAEKLGISVDAVKTQRKRGKDLLKAGLDHTFLIFLVNLI
ncbi:MULTISPECIES: RNA polymerase sigma factor [Gabonibacter]|uniref:RNA polymerase sigma factor n=1 Tax=Gabonibacter TaxID=1911312 RepID=UPI00073EB316|nr:MULTISPECIES: sigma-70 family RNA polymerase sigma factor [Gabonibacter]MCR9013217.1 sigma-70 family RNA polymerase sigma factor [Gabonibacter chumensis]